MNQKKKLAIVFGCTKNMTFALANVILGLRKYSPGLGGEFVVYHDGISQADQKILSSLMPGKFLLYDRVIPGVEKFGRISNLAFSRYECFNLLKEYERCMWLDIDLLVLGETKELSDCCQTGIGLYAHPGTPMKVSFSKPLPGFDMEKTCFNSGVIVLKDNLPGFESLSGWCYDKTAKWIDHVNSDQAVLNLMLQEFKLEVSPVAERFNCHPNLLTGATRIVHPWGPQKFWNGFDFEEWNKNYREWLKLGGSKCHVGQGIGGAPGVSYNLLRQPRKFFKNAFAAIKNAHRPEAGMSMEKALTTHNWGKSYPCFSGVITERNLKKGVEIGVAFGGHSDYILTNTQVEKLYGVDSYQHRKGYEDPMNLPQREFDKLHQYVLRRFSRFGDRYTHIRKPSIQAAEQIPAGSIDFVYIDAEHTYDAVKVDLAIWFEKVKPGGIVGGHDYGSVDFPGVQKAVDEFCSARGMKVVPVQYGVWWAEKPN